MFKTPYNYSSEDNKGEINTLPSETRQSDYESMNDLVRRVIRGEIRPDVDEDMFEYDTEEDAIGDLKNDSIVDDVDFEDLDAGSLYEDRYHEEEQVNQEGVDVENNENNAQATSGAATLKASDATLPE